MATASTNVVASTFSAIGNSGRGATSTGAAVSTTHLPPGESLSEATAAIQKAIVDIQMPPTIRGTFAGTAQMFQQSLNNEKILILAALFTIYIVLDILYERFIHPITILST